MLNFKRHIATLLIGGLALLTVGCASSDNEGFEPGVPEQPAMPTTAYVSLNIGVYTGATSRALGGPEGGDDGDGREFATVEESTVNNVVLLLYKSSTGINDEASTPIDHVIHFTVNQADEFTGRYDRVYETDPVEVSSAILTATPAYRAIVIANAGDVDWTTVRTLGQARDYAIDRQWQTDAAGIASNFVMSSQIDDIILDAAHTGDGSGTGNSKSSPLRFSTTIERLAARIDIQPNSTYNADLEGYPYEIVDDAGLPTGDIFLLKSVSVVNSYTGSSYLIKRTWDETNGTTYLGSETTRDITVEDALGSHTVKTATNWIAGLNIVNSAAANYTSSANIPVAPTAPAKDWFFLSYVHENSFTSYNPSNRYTGLRFNGRVYTAAEWNGGNPSDGAGLVRIFPTAAGEYYQLRHSDPEELTLPTDPMHYGVVRNNIYRVAIRKVIGDSSDPQLVLEIIACPWAVYTHDPIYM